MYIGRKDLSGEAHLTESNLIDRARRRDETAWEILVNEHQQAAFRLAYLLLGDVHEAEDAAQEAFIRAYGALDRFDTSRPFRPWLLRITANLARNRYRASARYLSAIQRLIRLQPVTAASPASPGGLSGGNGVSHDYAKREETHMLWQAVRRLNPAEQEIVYLRYFLDMPEAETAQALEIAIGTVKSRLHRALNRLRTIVEREYPALREMVKG